MPTPIAHASLALFARPLLVRWRLADLPRRRRWWFYALVGLTLGAPDVDFALLLLPDHPMHEHGTYMHSFGAAILAAPMFGLAGYWLLQRVVPWWRLALVGLLVYSMHLVMDFFTPGRGVVLLWPVMNERFASPLPLFVGAAHSDLWAWRWHLLTLVTELVFAAIVWLAARRVTPRRDRLPSPPSPPAPSPGEVRGRRPWGRPHRPIASTEPTSTRS